MTIDLNHLVEKIKRLDAALYLPYFTPEEAEIMATPVAMCSESELRTALSSRERVAQALLDRKQVRSALS